MGKTRKQRISSSNVDLSTPTNDNKITLTSKQLNDVIVRVRINQMKQCGFNRNQIQKTIGCSLKTIDRWGNIGFENNMNFIEDTRSGRPEVAQSIEKAVLKKRKNKSFSTRKVAIELGISHTIVKNILYDAEIKWKVRPKASKLNDNHKKARLEFCKKYQHKGLSWWDKILVTDSKIFLLDGGFNPKYHGRWVYDYEELDLYEVEKFSKGLHVYGGMTSKGLTPLVFINGGVTGERYVKEVLPKLINLQQRTIETNDVTTTKLFEDNNDWIFEHDHAKCHDSNIAQCFLQQNVPNFFNKDETPAKLDDVWCIERIWAVMTYKVYGDGKSQPKTLDELRKRINIAWKSLDKKILQKAIHQMPLRMKEIVKKKGCRVTHFKLHCECESCIQ
jgi:transposase